MKMPNEYATLLVFIAFQAFGCQKIQLPPGGSGAVFALNIGVPGRFDGTLKTGYSGRVRRC
jgi:hypothetical protein